MQLTLIDNCRQSRKVIVVVHGIHGNGELPRENAENTEPASQARNPKSGTVILDQKWNV